MLLLVGLGNPGPNSDNNRHNIGFKVIDAINQQQMQPKVTKKKVMTRNRQKKNLQKIKNNQYKLKI